MPRLPRFKRASNMPPMQLTQRDREIIRLVHRHRFLRSSHIVSLMSVSRQQILRRLQIMFHHGYLERPRAQLRYYERGGSRDIVYGLGNKSGKVMLEEDTYVHPAAWSEKNQVIGRLFLEHALFVSDIMVAIELACRKHGSVQLFYENREPFQWRVKLPNGQRLGVIPDRVFAFEYIGTNGQRQRAHYFLEADRGTMPVVRKHLSQTSFRRKLLAYEATWNQNIHHSHLGINRFRVLTVTTSAKRVLSLIEACSQLTSGQGLFLFADKSILSDDILSEAWKVGRAGVTKLSSLLP